MRALSNLFIIVGSEAQAGKYVDRKAKGQPVAGSLCHLSVGAGEATVSLPRRRRLTVHSMQVHELC